jgi:hypothetical protein
MKLVRRKFQTNVRRVHNYLGVSARIRIAVACVLSCPPSNGNYPPSVLARPMWVSQNGFWKDPSHNCNVVVLQGLWEQKE